MGNVLSSICMKDASYSWSLGTKTAQGIYQVGYIFQGLVSKAYTTVVYTVIHVILLYLVDGSISVNNGL